MIGVFDSGVGGLTVLRELRAAMPHADFLYFGDTAHAPYGPRQHEELVQLTVDGFALLRARGAAHIVSACNSVSATVALERMRGHELGPPDLVDMVGPAVESLADSSGSVLLLATEATVRSGIYQDAFGDYGREVYAVAIPALAGALERGVPECELDALVHAALAGVSHDSFDTVLLGCTHFPLAMTSFEKALPGVRIVDPAAAVAAAAASRFAGSAEGQGALQFLVSKESVVFDSWVQGLFPHAPAAVVCTMTK